MRLAKNGAREAGIASLRVASSVQRAIGKDVYDAGEQRIGGLEDLYIDCQVSDVHFQEVGPGSFLGLGEMPLLGPVEACVEVAEDRFTIEPDRTEKVDGLASFDTKVAPPRADEPRDDEVRLVSIKTVIDLL